MQQQQPLKPEKMTIEYLLRRHQHKTCDVLTRLPSLSKTSHTASINIQDIKPVISALTMSSFITYFYVKTAATYAISHTMPKPWKKPK